MCCKSLYETCKIWSFPLIHRGTPKSMLYLLEMIMFDGLGAPLWNHGLAACSHVLRDDVTQVVCNDLHPINHPSFIHLYPLNHPRFFSARRLQGSENCRLPNRNSQPHETRRIWSSPVHKTWRRTRSISPQRCVSTWYLWDPIKRAKIQEVLLQGGAAQL